MIYSTAFVLEGPFALPETSQNAPKTTHQSLEQ